jgi:hypothetical protein
MGFWCNRVVLARRAPLNAGGSPDLCVVLVSRLLW